ncbi:MAG TPA: ATP-binding cassette domain-containing protein [Gemmatimonadales bacterium]|nr:ATP-binding cassette domain-containing protein [Gemmatimonadales bacterium]
MSLLQLQDVAKRFDGITAVDQVSFTVDRGQVVGFLGPNGAGKSTTMRMITQFLDPDAGTIHFDGVPVANDPRGVKRRIGYLPENNPLYGEMLVSDYLDFIADLRQLSGTGKARAIDEAVHATGLDAVFYRPIGDLSKGFRQRTGLAQAILHRPELLVLDEPTEGLDPNQRLEIRHLIADLGKERTVLLSTHVLSEVRQSCSRLLIINKGRIVADGAVDTLVQRAEGGRQVRVEAKGDRVLERLGAVPGVARVQPDVGTAGVRAVVTVSGETDVRPAIFELAKREGWTLYELHEEQGNLEELFRQLTTESGAEAAS